MINVLHLGDKLTMGGATIHGVTKLFSIWLPAFDSSRFNVSLCILRKRDVGGEYLESFGIKPIYLNRQQCLKKPYCMGYISSQYGFILSVFCSYCRPKSFVGKWVK